MIHLQKLQERLNTLHEKGYQIYDTIIETKELFSQQFC